LLAPRSLSTAVAARTQPTPETVSKFRPPDLPESIALGAGGDIFLSMAVTGDLAKLTPTGDRSTVASLRPGNGLLLGHALDAATSRSYALLNSRTKATHGLWQIPHQETQEARRIAQFSPDTVLSNLVIGPDGTNTYISAARATESGGGGGGRNQYSISENGYYWTTGFPDQPRPTKRTTPEITPPDDPVDVLSLAGPAGITVHGGSLYVLDRHGGRLLRSQLAEDGEPGEFELVVEASELRGGDGMTFDDERTLYAAVPTRNQIVRVSVDQRRPPVETVIAADAFDFPTDVRFGQGSERRTLYICNSALRTYQKSQRQQQAQQKPAPSVMKVDLG
jgi:hypothetical protein